MCNHLFTAAPEEVFAALRDFGYKSFRPGQEVAIMRILSGRYINSLWLLTDCYFFSLNSFTWQAGS